MPKLSINRSIVIDAPASKIFSFLNNFDNWREWSPWLLMEPEAQVTVEPDKKSYQWNGKRVGSGNMKILDEKENLFVHYDLNFLKPFKSHATTSFQLEEDNGSTKVSWSMDSKLPFFLFFMKKSMEAYVGSDYDRGLNLLKVLVEEGAIPSKMEMKGRGTFEGCKLIGVKSTCNIKDIGDRMSADLKKTWEFISNDESNIEGRAISIYHKYDMIKGTVSYTTGFLVKEITPDLPNGLVSFEIPSTRVYSIEHTGPYKFLGNVWGTLYTMQRNKEFATNKKILPFETYLNDPATTPENELITVVYFPTK